MPLELLHGHIKQVPPTDPVEASQFVAELEAKGFRVPSGSRFSRYAAVMKHLATRGSAKDLHLLVQASHEITSFSSAIHNLEQRALLDEWRSIISQCLAGGCLPHQENPRRNSPRDLQFEVAIAGLLARAGIDGHPREPDVQCRLSGQRIAIAAKRPHSLKRLPKLFSGAGEQLTKARGLGVLAIDITLLTSEPGRHLTTSKGDGALLLLPAQRALTFFREHLDPLARLLPLHKMAGMLVYAAVPVGDAEGHPMGWRECIIPANIHAGHLDHRAAVFSQISMPLAIALTGSPPMKALRPGEAGYPDLADESAWRSATESEIQHLLTHQANTTPPKWVTGLREAERSSPTS